MRTAERTFTVAGRGDFPRDMLRYDECTFATPKDEAAAGTGYVSGRREVVLVLNEGARPIFRPTRARWDSFGWEVVDTNHETIDVRPAKRSASGIPNGAPRFPVELRKMWTGAEVQDWINSNWPNKK